MVTVRILDNGIKVALESISYVRSISFGIWVKNGTRNELPHENGVSHYIEHMMFKGTENRTAREIAEENGFTTDMDGFNALMQEQKQRARKHQRNKTKKPKYQ